MRKTVAICLTVMGNERSLNMLQIHNNQTCTQT